MCISYLSWCLIFWLILCFSGQSRGSGALRISELGTRVGRILRIMRLIRLMRLSKAIQKKDQGDASKVQDVNDVRQVQFDSRVRVLTKQFNKGFVEDQVSDYEADSPWRECKPKETN